MSEDYVHVHDIGHDEFNYGLPKLPPATALKFDKIHGVLPFDGVRNPGFRSSTSHTVWFTYKTEANNWQPKVAICESGSEGAVAHEALIDGNTFDVRFQPLTVDYELDGEDRQYTHDLLIVRKDLSRRLVFVRNGASLTKPKTWREIVAIVQATPPTAANDMIVVNADQYTRQRRDNLFCMHELVQEKDDEADDIVHHVASNLKTLWQIHDLFPHVPLPQWRTFRACYRLIARKKLLVNMDHLIVETSRVQVAA